MKQNFIQKHKKFVTLILCASILLGSFCYMPTQIAEASTPTKTVARVVSDETKNASEDAYWNDWVYWMQGASKYGLVSFYGCHMVAYSKLLMEAGCPVDKDFDPDKLYEWGRSTTYGSQNKPYVLSNMNESNCAGRGNMVVKYAETKNFKLRLVESVDVSNVKTDAEKLDIVMTKINAGYYVILDCGWHWTYVLREKSKRAGCVWISDSWGKTAVNPACVTKYTNWSNVWKGRPTNLCRIYVYSAPSNTNTSGNGVLALGETEDSVAKTFTVNTNGVIDLNFYDAEGYDPATDAASVKWFSFNTDYVKVDQNGVVTGIKSPGAKIACSLTVSATGKLYTGTASIVVNYATATPTPTNLPPIETTKCDDWVKTTSNVNYRSGPGTDNARLGTFSKDTTLHRVGTTNNNWTVVETKNSAGQTIQVYIGSDYVKKTTPTNTPTPKATNTPKPTSTPKATSSPTPTPARKAMYVGLDAETAKANFLSSQGYTWVSQPEDIGAIDLDFFGVEGYNGDTDRESIKWKSGDESVVKVDESGVLTFLTSGRAVIYCALHVKSTNTNYSGSIRVNVVTPTPTPTPTRSLDELAVLLQEKMDNGAVVDTPPEVDAYVESSDDAENAIILIMQKDGGIGIVAFPVDWTAEDIKSYASTMWGTLKIYMAMYKGDFTKRINFEKDSKWYYMYIDMH